MIFLDTNIWTYATIVQDPLKRRLAQKIIKTALTRDDFVISTQVISECANTLFRRGNKKMADVLGVVHWMESLPYVVNITPAIVKRAIEIKTLYGISFYDAQIIATAENSGCEYIISEDLSSTQTYADIACINPFINTPQWLIDR